MPNISKSLPTVAVLAAVVVVLIAYHAVFPHADITLRPFRLRESAVAASAEALAGEAKNFRIPVNRASAHELQYFFGTTDRRAKAIVRERDASPLYSKADLARVREIPPAERERIAAFMDFSTGGGASSARRAGESRE